MSDVASELAACVAYATAVARALPVDQDAEEMAARLLQEHSPTPVYKRILTKRAPVKVADGVTL